MLNIPPAMLIANIFVLIIAFTIHEFAHAWTANYFGDDTPRLNGRLTLNPLVHLDVMGSLMLLIAGFGWAKPVPIDPYLLRRKSSSALMWVSLSGPLSNLCLAILGSLLLRSGFFTPAFPTGLLPTPSQVLTQFVFINIILALFNFLPIPPLDGDEIFAHFFPYSWNNWMDRYIRPYGPVILLLLIFVLPMVGINLLRWVIFIPSQNIFRLLVL